MVILAFSVASVVGLVAAAGVGTSPLVGGKIKNTVAGSFPVMSRQDSSRSERRERFRNEDEVWFAAKMDRLQAEEDEAERARLNPFPTSPNMRFPPEILERIIHFAFETPSATPRVVHPSLPHAHALAILLVARGFHRFGLPYMYRSIFIRKQSDWTLYFHPSSGIFNHPTKGRTRRSWVREFLLVDHVPPPPPPSDSLWSTLLTSSKARALASAIHLPPSGFESVINFCIVQSPPKFVTCTHLIPPLPYKAPPPPEEVDVEGNPGKKHHLLMMELYKLCQPRTFHLPYAALVNFHLPALGGLLIPHPTSTSSSLSSLSASSPSSLSSSSLATPVHTTPGARIFIHFPPPKASDDQVRITHQSRCYAAHLGGTVRALWEGLEWEEMHLVGFPGSCMGALGPSLRKKNEGGWWREGGVLDWYYEGRWGGEGGERMREAKGLKVEVEFAL